jgi:hypothetical protein
MPLVLIIKNKIYKNTCSRGEPWACYENNFNMGEKLGAIFAIGLPVLQTYSAMI